MSELKTKVIIGTKEKPVRFSYANVFKPKAANEGEEPKYSVSVIIPKENKEDIAKIEKAIENAIELGKSKLGKIPKDLKTPLRDGDEERDDEAYADSMFINANSNRKPGIVNEDLEEIIEVDEFYSGCYGRVAVNFYAYNVGKSKGIAAGLQNLQKTEDGEALSGGSTAAQDFGSGDEDDLL